MNFGLKVKKIEAARFISVCPAKFKSDDLSPQSNAFLVRDYRRLKAYRLCSALAEISKYAAMLSPKKLTQELAHEKYYNFM